MQGETKSGYKFDIDDRILTDWRFTTALAKCQKSESVKQLEGMTDMVNLLFGDKLDEFMNHIAEQNDGYIPTEAIMADVQDIFASKIPKN